MFLNIIIKSLKNKKKVDILNSISKIKKFKSKLNAFINRIFLFKIKKKNNKENDNFEKKERIY